MKFAQKRYKIPCDEEYRRTLSRIAVMGFKRDTQ